jgi:hypothetical protein
LLLLLLLLLFKIGIKFFTHTEVLLIQ